MSLCFYVKRPSGTFKQVCSLKYPPIQFRLSVNFSYIPDIKTIILAAQAKVVNLDHFSLTTSTTSLVTPLPTATMNQTKLKYRPGLQCVSQNFWQMVSEVSLKFWKFATNLAISLCSCQSNRPFATVGHVTCFSRTH